jgi:hypothetical protein
MWRGLMWCGLMRFGFGFGLVWIGLVLVWFGLVFCERGIGRQG